MVAIRPEDLPAAGSVNPSAALIVDDGTSVQKATPLQIADAAIPLASQAEAEAGVNNTKRMSPLRVKQAIDAQVNFAQNFVNVTQYGASEASPDNTAAFNAAMAAAKAVFVPEGNFITSNLIAQQEGQILFGVGPASRVTFKTGSTGFHFTSNGHAAGVRDIDFFGGDDGGKAGTPAAATRSALKLDYDKGCFADYATIHGYDSTAIGPANAASSVAGLCMITNCNIYSCWQGVDGRFAEYTRWLGNSITSCRQGFYKASGNMTIADNLIEYNYDNILVEGTGDGNNGHGGIINNRLNHANHFAVYVNAITNGDKFIGNDIFYGDISITGSSGLQFIGNTISVAAIGISGGNRNIFAYNFAITDGGSGLNNTVTQVGGKTVFENNFEASGNPIWSNGAPIFGQEAFTAGDQIALQVRETGTAVTNGLIDYGLLFMANGSDGSVSLKRRTAGATASTPLMKFMRGANQMGFFGATPVGQQSVAAAATDAATTQTLANSLRTALINLGLAT